MIKIKLNDAEGHGYWLYDDGQFVLALKAKPSVGPQFKIIAWLRKGVFALSHPHWHEKDQCWYISRLPLLKTAAFGIKIIQLKEEIEGFVHPRVLTSRNAQWHSTGYEVKLKLLPKDLQKTQEAAVEVWRGGGNGRG
jgi:hypothetical protein